MTIFPSSAQPPNNTGSVSPMVTEIGRVWEDRWQVSERWFKANSYDWDALYNLFTNVYEQRNRWGTNISMGWSVIQAIVEDTVPQLPEPWIMPRTSGIDPSVPKMLRDVAKTIHKHQDLHGLLKRARILCSYSSMPCIWPTFEQTSEAYGENDESIAENDYETPIAGYRATEQIVKLELRSGWDMRYDVYGRNWDLSDHGWVGTIYYPTVEDCLEDPNFENKDLLERWARNLYQERRMDNAMSPYAVGYDEKDFRYVHIEMQEIWSMAEMKRIWKPARARFHVGYDDWPEEWRKAGKYPCVPVALNWEGDDRRAKKGFYAVPDLRLIRSQLENLNRLEGLYADSVTNAVKKYFYPDGIFDDKAFTKILSDTNREFIGINWKMLKSKLGVESGQEFNPAQIDLRNLIMLMPQEDRSLPDKHESAIRHNLELIYETLGQSPADRGGAMATAKSATQAIQIGQGQQRRLNAQAEQIADIVDDVDERIFTLLRANQTLPLPYQASGDYSNDSSWQTFMAQDIEDMDLAYFHHAGSSVPIDREAYRFEVREIMTQILPLVIQGSLSPEAKFLVRELLSTYDVPGAERAFNDVIPDLVKQGLYILSEIDQGAKNPTDPRVAQQFLEIFSELLHQLATPADMQQVVAAQAGGENNVAKMGARPRAANLRASKSPAQIAASSAAGGQVGATGQ